MRLYLAGLYTSRFSRTGRLYLALDEAEKRARDTPEFFLESYHYINTRKKLEPINRDKVKIFLDSGAFSAFTKGIEVDLPKYCKFVWDNWQSLEVQDNIILASVLDGIGDPLKTYQNQLEMERLGVPALPCYHYGEDERYLEYYIERYPYITIGGMVPISTKQLFIWLDRIWSKYLCDKDGFPKLKVHGFGLTSLPLMKRYPWFSVDSSTWVQWAANGMLLVPGIGQVNISARSSSRKKEGQHFHTIAKKEQDIIREHIEKLGFKIERLEHHYTSRWAFNCWAFFEEAKKNIVTNFFVEQEELF